jgi:diguanylate cyclase (GGDEF)-like protein/PAS domain S-box-containing protein
VGVRQERVLQGDIISAAARRGSGELLELLGVMTAILRRFAGLLDRDLDAGINDALAAIGTHADVDRCYLFLVSDDGEFVSNTHEWCAEGIFPEIENLQQVPFDTIGWWWPRLQAGESVYIPKVAALPEGRRPERELLSGQSIQSLLVVPLTGPDRLRGFLGFDSVRSEREWSPEAQLSLQAVADILVGAMARRDSLSMLLTKERRFAALVEHSTDVLIVLDSDWCITYLGPTAARLFGVKGWEPFGFPLLDCCHPADRVAVSAALAAVCGGEVGSLPDFRVRCGKAGWTWLMGTVRDLRHDPAVAGIVLNAQDINERKEAERSLQHQATHDALTGLPNRLLLGELLDRASGRCRRSGDCLGVLFIDLDHFKLINDGQGHRIGDELLVDVAWRLLNELRQEDTVARFGGDEFVVVLSAPAGQESSLVSAAERLLRVFSDPFEVEGARRAVTASAGLAVSDGSDTVEEILGKADAAMYLAKESGRACLRCFDEALRDQLLERIELERELSGACQRGELCLHYQPIYATASRTLTGFEALLRWNHPERGLVHPGQFIAAAEQSGLIVNVGAWALDEAVAQLRRWADRYPALELSMSVNLSPVQLRDPAFPLLVQAALERWQLPAPRLCLEVTETALMEHRDRSIETLQRLRNLGTLLAIDDFGTGHSSLAYLRDLPVNKLKIDKSFVQHMVGAGSDHSIVAAIQLLADEYGLQTVAEGVETEDQELALRALGCDMLQGFHLGRPLSPEAAEALVCGLARGGEEEDPGALP